MVLGFGAAPVLHRMRTEGFTGTRKCLGPYRRSLEVEEENARLLGETAAPSRVRTTCLPTTHPAPFVGEEQPSDPGCVRACDMARTQAEASGQRDQTPQGLHSVSAGREEALRDGLEEGAKSSLGLRRRKAWVQGGRDLEQWGKAVGPRRPAPDSQT